MQTVLCLMLNRYRLIRGEPQFPICTTYAIISTLWLNSTLQALLWQCLSPGAPLNHLNTQAAGVVLNNLLALALALPVPVVIVLMILITRKARQHIARLARDHYDISQQMQGDLKLLYVFGVVYVLGFGFTCVNNFI